MANQRKSTRESTSNPNAALDNPLYLPRLDQLELSDEAVAGAGPSYATIIETICGVADDSQAVEQYDGTLGVPTTFVDAHQRPAIQVQWNDNLGSIYTNPGNVTAVRWGSGTLISEDLMLTCGHLFDVDPNGWTVPRQNGTANAISPTEIATNMHINVLYQVDSTGVLRAEQRFPITQLLEFRLGGLDMAICRIGGRPGRTYGWTEVSTTNPTVGEMLAILGHPAGQPKRIEAGPCTSISATTVRYDDIDTLGGNSGSGILQGATGRVVGVHTNGGCNSAGTGTNSGVAIAAIRNVSPTLQALPAGSSTGNAYDVHGTRLADDIRNTLRAADTMTARAMDTALAVDILGTTLARDIGTWTGADNPRNTRAETVINPGDPVFDPPLGDGIGALFDRLARLRPLVLAAESALDAEEEDANGSVIGELESVIDVQRAVLASLESIHAAVAQAVR